MESDPQSISIDDIPDKHEQIKLKSSTLDRIEALKRILKEEKSSNVIIKSLDMSHAVYETLRKGGTVNLKQKNGQIVNLVLPNKKN